MKNYKLVMSIVFAGVFTSAQAVTMSGNAYADDSVRIPGDLCEWNEAAWSDFNTAEVEAWSGLGWEKQIWDNSAAADYPASYHKSWSELAVADKEFARKLGYSSETWGVANCPNYSTTTGKKFNRAGLVGTLGTSGYGELVGLYSFDSDADGSASKQDYSGLGGGGHVNFWLGDSYTLQIDGAASFFRNDDSDYRVFAMEALVHAGWRDPDKGYFGAFGGLLSYGYAGYSGTGCSGSCSFDQYVIGGEGAVYWDTMTFFAQGGFMDSRSADGGSRGNSFTNTWFGRGGLRYFANPNVKLEASGGILSGDQYTNKPVDMPFWKIGGEYKPDDSRVSWFASYGGYSEDEIDYEHTNHTVAGGVRVHFDQKSLMSFDRSGASLDFFDTRMLIQAYDH